MYAFDYHKPSTVAEAAALLARHTEAKLLAGGMTLIPTLKQRLASPTDLIDLAGITELKGISQDGATLVIGATATHAEVAEAPLVRRLIPALAALAEGIGDPQVRNRGTLGGSVANNDPAADYPAAVLGLGATVVTHRRSIAAEDFFTGMFSTALDQDELITAIRFPVPENAAYAKFPNPASRYATAGVFVAKTGGKIRVAVTGAGQGGVFRVPEMEEALAASFAPAALAGITVPPEDLNSDLHASAEYRAHLVSVMAKRAIAAAG